MLDPERELGVAGIRIARSWGKVHSERRSLLSYAVVDNQGTNEAEVGVAQVNDDVAMPPMTRGIVTNKLEFCCLRCVDGWNDTNRTQ